MTSRTDALGNTMYWGNTSGLGGYNIANQNVMVTYPATGQTGTGNSRETTTYLYPGGPEVSTQSFDESGAQIRQVQSMYGPEGELLATEGSTEFVSYTYDGLYRVHTLTDGNGHATTYYYNGQGYLDTVTYPGYTGPTPQYSTSAKNWSQVSATGADSVHDTAYDAFGDVLQRIDGRGVVTNYTYADPENNLTNVSYNVSAAAGVPSQPPVTLTYDGFGRLATADNGVTQTHYGYTTGGTTAPGYDDDDNPLNVQTGYYQSGAIAFTKNINYSYYPDGSKSAMVTPAGTFNYNYDAAGRPTSETNPFSETTSWTYLNNNWLAGQTLGNGAVTSYTYNAKALVTDLTNKDSSGNVLSDFGSMTYDGVGNRTSVTANYNSDTAYSGTTSYSYDSKNELTAESKQTIPAAGQTAQPVYANAFAYDAAENPTTFRSTSGAAYNSDNQNAGSNYDYDGNGNPTTYKGAAYTFDAENRLTTVGTTLTAGYGAGDLRAWRTDTTGTTYFLYGNETTTPVCELNSSGSLIATNTYTINGIASRNTGGASIYYEFDQQGNVAERLNSSGSSTSTSTTDAFGNVANSATATDPFGYTGQEGYYTDLSTGLILTTFRYYDPSNGRFVNRDPDGYQGGIGLYTYCENEPADDSDPMGTDSNEVHWNDGVYTRNKVGDRDINKGYPHWDVKGTKLWIGNDGFARGPNGCKQKIKDKSTLREIDNGIEQWRRRGEPIIAPQQNKFVPTDPPLMYDQVNLLPIAIIMGPATGGILDGPLADGECICKELQGLQTVSRGFAHAM